MNDPATPTASHPAAWKWSVCGVLLLATMLNYMDRQTLSQTKTDIKNELGLSDTYYGRLELGFGIAFAVGGLATGLVVDRLSVRWLYPAVVLCWSCAGFATAYAAAIGQALDRAWSALGGAPVVFPELSHESSQTYLGLLGQGFQGEEICRNKFADRGIHRFLGRRQGCCLDACLITS